MGSGTRRKLIIAAGLLVAASITAAAFFYASMLGIFTLGLLTMGGFILLDRLNQKLWEHSISFMLNKIGETQRRLTSDVSHAVEEIQGLKERAVETSQAGESEQAPPAAPATTRPEKNILSARRPAAAAPPATSKRTYDALVATQLPQLTDMAMRQILTDAVRNQRIEVFMQPIVRLPQRKVRFYEMFARLRARPGHYVPAMQYKKIAQDNMMMHSIDRLILTEGLDLIRATAKLDHASPFFFNVSSASLKDAAFMQKLLEFLSAHRALAPRLIFELAHGDFKKLPPSVIQIIVGLGKLGCGFSIDNVTDFNFDLGKMLQMKIRYVKIPARDLMASSDRFDELKTIQKRLESNGITIIAEKIENERMLAEISDFDINFGQGHLFGKPNLQSAYQEKNTRNKRRFSA